MRSKFKAPRTRKTVRKTKKTYTKPTVMYKVIKPEKKYVDYIPQIYNGDQQLLPNVIGQVNGTGDGVYISDISPNPTIGTNYNNRLGQLISLSSMVIRAQFISQEDLKTSLNFNIMIFCRKDPVVPIPSGNSTGSLIFDSNGYNGLYDINALRDSNGFSTYKQLYNKTHYIPADTFSTQGDRLKDVRINLKCNKRLRYRDETNNILLENQLILVIRCNTGNCSAVDPSTNPDIALTAVNTGARMLMSIRAYFTDI